MSNNSYHSQLLGNGTGSGTLSGIIVASPDPAFLSLIGSSVSSDAVNSQDISQYSPEQLYAQGDEHGAATIQFCIDVAILRRCWQFERGCRDLLPYPTSYIDAVKEYMQRVENFLLEEQERRLTFQRYNNDQQDTTNGILEQYAYEAYDMELERLRFLLSDLHRTRLHKIEAHPLYYQFQENNLIKLSNPEKTFLTNYINLLQTLLGNSLAGLPGKYGREKLVYESPRLYHVVLMRCQNHVPQFYLSDQLRSLYANTVVVASYEDCLPWIGEGSLDVV